MRLMITGAIGFVGQAVTEAGCHAGHDVAALVRKESELLPARATQFAVGDFAAIAEFSGYPDLVETKNINSPLVKPALNDKLLAAMRGIDVVIHTAARAHVMYEHLRDAEVQYHLINVALRLAEAAAQAGVKRFVFISSIKVNGEASTKPFLEADVPAHEDDYGRSKWRTEQCLTEIGQRTGMEIVILRPPLIYGPGVKGNFASLIKLINKGIPLPFGAINNQRSLLALDNLASAILLASQHPASANQTFLLADNEDVSLTQLIKLIAQLQGKKARLIPVPVRWMQFVAKVLGKQAVAERLLSSLQIDTAKIRQTLGWKPSTSMAHQLAKISIERLN